MLYAAFVLTWSGCRDVETRPDRSVDIPVRSATIALPDDPDDPAIWVHPTNPSRSLILGTNKAPFPRGAVFVFSLNGQVRQVIGGLNRPNNVDVEYDFALVTGRCDIAVVTERNQRRLRVYRIRADGTDLEEIASPKVFMGEAGDRGAPMGIGLYRRPSDGVVFAIVSRKDGPRLGYLWQYRMESDDSGGVRIVKVREFGSFSGKGEIEAIAVDDELGHVYYADERGGIRKWHADPDHPEAEQELASFGLDGFSGDREGIAIYTLGDHSGYIICTDQLDGNSRYHLYRREGEPGNPHDHSRLVKTVRAGADATDGIEVTAEFLGPNFPTGLFVAMHSRERCFLLLDWKDIATAGNPQLRSREVKPSIVARP
jgi:3-phytase